jgi:hypothetical protein
VALTESSRDRRPDFPFLEAKFKLGEDELEIGRICQGHVHLRNAGNDLIELESEQPIVASILDPSTMERVGGYSGWIAGTGLMIRLGPGDVARITVLVGTATRKNGEILTLPPGEYLVKVDVPLFELRPDEEGYEKSHLHLPLVDLRVVERRPWRS